MTFEDFLKQTAPGATVHQDGFTAQDALHPGDLLVIPHAQKKPWGGEIWWIYVAAYAMKTLFVKTGCRLSYQSHNEKEETWQFVTKGWAIIEDIEYEFEAGTVVHLKPGTRHRLMAKDTDVIVLEVSTGQLMDVVRYSDDFGRGSSSEPTTR